MSVGIVDAVQIKCGTLTLAASTLGGMKTSNGNLNILVSTSRTWSMLTPAEVVIRCWPEAVTCQVDCASRLKPAADRNDTAASNAAW